MQEVELPYYLIDVKERLKKVPKRALEQELLPTKLHWDSSEKIYYQRYSYDYLHPSESSKHYINFSSPFQALNFLRNEEISILTGISEFLPPINSSNSQEEGQQEEKVSKDNAQMNESHSKSSLNSEAMSEKDLVTNKATQNFKSNNQVEQAKLSKIRNVRFAELPEPSNSPAPSGQLSERKTFYRPATPAKLFRNGQTENEVI